MAEASSNKARGVLGWLETRPPSAQPFFWFGGLILVGGLLLSLPAARTPAAADDGVLAALFMATSTVCVTGLAVVPVDTHFSVFGQAVLLALIEMGGLGLITFATVGFQLFRRRLTLASHAAPDDALFGRGAASDFRRTFARVVKVVLGVQAAGAAWLFMTFLPYAADRAATWPEAAGEAAWLAVFHAVSAFCNAGLTLFPGSLEAFSRAPSVLIPVTLLILAGAFGHAALAECHRRARAEWRMRAAIRRARRRGRFVAPGHVKPLSLHARVVLWMTVGLSVGGGLVLWGVSQHAGGSVHFFDAFFTSVSARTAGMQTLPLERLGVAGLAFLAVLMFVGGSPGSCAGGIKTTSCAIWLSALVNGLRSRPDVTLFGRVIVPELVTKAKLLVGLSCAFNVLGVMVLCMTEPNAPAGFAEARRAGERLAAAEAGRPAAAVAPPPDRTDVPPAPPGGPAPAWGLVDLLVEQVSAFGTVGLSTGVTPTLSAAGRWWVMLSMFLGRLGPLSLALWIMPVPRGLVRGAHGRVMIG